MRIAHVIGTLDPASGGPIGVAMRLAAAQARLGHAVTILTPPEPEKTGDIDKAAAAIPGFALVRRASIPQPGVPAALLGVGRAPMDRSVREYDWLHLHGIWEPIILNAGRAASSAGVPYALAPHGMFSSWALGRRSIKKRVALAAGFRSVVKSATFLHALNEEERASFDHFAPGIPSRVIPNGVFLEEIDPLPKPEAFLSDHPELRGRKYVLFMSRLHPGKGLDLLLPAFAEIARQRDDVDLVIAGPDAGARDETMSTITRLGLTPRVHVVGPVYGPLRFSAMTGALMFCLPSRHEGFSLAIAEALACAAPVVITDQCHFPEVQSHDAGKVVPIDVAALAEALRQVLADPLHARAMGLRGRALIESNYTWPRIAERTVGFYEQCAPQPR